MREATHLSQGGANVRVDPSRSQEASVSWKIRLSDPSKQTGSFKATA